MKPEGGILVGYRERGEMGAQGKEEEKRWEK